MCLARPGEEKEEEEVEEERREGPSLAERRNWKREIFVTIGCLLARGEGRREEKT